MEPVRVFLVDDHPLVREGVRRLLELEEQIKVVGEAASTEEALEKVDAEAADVMMMDIRLPGIDGIEATRRLSESHPELKVIILSSFGNEYLSQAIEAGADGYVMKTASRAELVNSVLQAANGRAAIDPTLTASLFDQFANMARLARQQGLSGRQREILRGVAAGIPSKQIASTLAISDATFKREIKNILNYLGVNDRAQAVAEAYNRRLL